MCDILKEPWDDVGRFNLKAGNTITGFEVRDYIKVEEAR